ncbi:MAG: hypothetical protein AB7F40_10260 [Victivallaceae bacterium]
MKKQDIRCSNRECRWCGNNPDTPGACECPAMVIETDIFTGECLNFKARD